MSIFSTKESSYPSSLGNCETQIDGALIFLAGSLWNNSSVKNGIKWCSTINPHSKMNKNIFFVLFFVSSSKGLLSDKIPLRASI